ncbi:MAG: hypothetical protein K0S44_1592 [Bacteroidetes bacterium]|jgi:hypothetical protein|nr:hypothetical protein [Bacteroidota bacterium]
MKKTLFIATLLFSEIAFSQSIADPLRDVNNQLRAMFSPLARPTPSRLFLYEMTAHMADSSFFTHYSTDTSNLDNWLFINREMFYSAYDTTVFERTDSIYKRGNKYANDTVPIGIMDYDFYTFKPDALNTNIYFNFDTINGILSDKPGRPSFPYNINNLFSACPLVNETHSAEVTFRIDPAFIFADIFNQGHYIPEGTILKMDFGDGTGWHTFAGNTVEYHSALYTTDGDKIIQVAIYADGVQVKLSTSKIYTPSTVYIQPDQTINNINGITCGVYGGCGDSPFNKVIIYLEGWDLMDFMPSKNRGVAEIYEKRIKESELGQLRNFGYTVIVVDWKNSRKRIQENAMHVVDLINALKCKYTKPTNDNQYVIIGESMGGLVARYALCYMESPLYQTECFPEKKHNTRLLLTFDSPHRGASLPISYQWMYTDAMAILQNVIPVPTHLITYASNLFLGSKSAQQMLLYHIDTRLPITNSTYTAHPERALFLTDIALLGNYPKNCKLMAMSDGSLSGKRQTNDYNGNVRTANDDFMNTSANLNVRILHYSIRIFNANLRLRSNPAGSAEVYRLEASTYGVRVKLKWFGVKVTVGLNSTLSHIAGAVNVKDYCTSAGGLSGQEIKAEEIAVSAIDWINSKLFGHHTVVNDGNGNYHMNAYSHPTLSLFGADATVHTEGMHFGFVPTYSALDYNTGGALNYNIETEPIAVKNTKTPFDVVMGIPDSKTGVNSAFPGVNMYKNQLYHTFPTNHVLKDFNGDPILYRSCKAQQLEARILNREIGDEEMWLDNMILNRRAMYEAEFDIHVNRPNPSYEYLTIPTTTITIKVFIPNPVHLLFRFPMAWLFLNMIM